MANSPGVSRLGLRGGSILGEKGGRVMQGMNVPALYYKRG